MSLRLLMVDDDELFVSAVHDFLLTDDIEVIPAHTVAAARALLAQEGFAIALLDNHLPDGDGLSLVEEIGAAREDAQILLCTAHPSLSNAVAALRSGIQDYLSKPITLEELRLSVLRTARVLRLRKIETVHHRDFEQSREQLVGSSSVMSDVRKHVERAGGLQSSVLLTGETGTGKSLLAKLIHASAPRADERPFVSLNCAALPESLIESELFGSERGAFTGATAARPGQFELADGGTLFLDEIGELAPSLQAKLLTALDDGMIRRIGGSRPRRVSVRVIAATNLEIPSALTERRLREDLYYRLSVLQIHMPPLRERISDLRELTTHFLARLAPGRSCVVADGEIERMSSYAWPGNTRELRNVLERAVVLQPMSALEPSHLLKVAPSARANADAAREKGQRRTLAEVERDYVLETLDQCGGNRGVTAQTLGIGIATLRRKLQEWRSK